MEGIREEAAWDAALERERAMIEALEEFAEEQTDRWNAGWKKESDG